MNNKKAGWWKDTTFYQHIIVTFNESTAVFSSSSSFTLSWHFCLISAWEIPKSFCKIKAYYTAIYFTVLLSMPSHAA